MSIVNIYNANGILIGWQPYSEKNISYYGKLWKYLYDSTVQELRKQNQNFDSLHKTFTDVESNIMTSIPSLKDCYSKYLKEEIGYDNYQILNAIENLENHLKKIFVKNLETALKINFDEKFKEILGQYYISSANILDWNNTIYIIELIKTVIPAQ